MDSQLAPGSEEECLAGLGLALLGGGAAGGYWVLPSGLWEMGVLLLRGHGLWGVDLVLSPLSLWAGCNWFQPTPLSPHHPLHHQKDL